VKLFFIGDELPNLDRVGDSLLEEENLLEVLPELKVLGLNLLGFLGDSVVVVVLDLVLKLNLDLVRVWVVLGLGLDVVADAFVLDGNLDLDLDLVRSLVALVVGSGTSEGACLLKPTLCLEEDWTGFLTELLSLTSSLGLTSLRSLCGFVKISERSPAKYWSLSTEQILYPLSGPLSTVS